MEGLMMFPLMLFSILQGVDDSGAVLPLLENGDNGDSASFRTGYTLGKYTSSELYIEDVTSTTSFCVNPECVHNVGTRYTSIGRKSSYSNGKPFALGNKKVSEFEITVDGKIYYYIEPKKNSKNLYFKEYGGNTIKYEYAKGKFSKIKVVTKGKVKCSKYSTELVRVGKYCPEEITVLIPEKDGKGVATSGKDNHWNIQLSFTNHKQYGIGFSSAGNITIGNVADNFTSPLGNVYALKKVSGTAYLGSINYSS